MDGRNILGSCSCQKIPCEFFFFSTRGWWWKCKLGLKHTTSCFTLYCRNSVHPRSACRLKGTWSRAAWWETLSTSTRRRELEGCGRYSTLRAVVKMLRRRSWASHRNCPPPSSPGRASLSPRSELPSWSEWSCPSTTSQRSTWSYPVTWETPCTLTSCKFADSHWQAVLAAISFIRTKQDPDLNAELMTLRNFGSSERRPQGRIIGWLTVVFFPDPPQVQFCVRPRRSFDL